MDGERNGALHPRDGTRHAPCRGEIRTAEGAALRRLRPRWGAAMRRRPPDVSGVTGSPVRSRFMRSRPLIVAALVLAGAAPPARAAAPLQPVQPGFRDQVVMEDLESPMAVRFAPPPDGRMFVAEKSGRGPGVSTGPATRDPPRRSTSPSEVHDFWDRGLLGMALDPAFATSTPACTSSTRATREIGGRGAALGRRLSRPAGRHHRGLRGVRARWSRVTVDELGVAGDGQDADPGRVVPAVPQPLVGTVAFGPDGMLYAGAGEGASFMEYDWGQLPGVSGYPRRTRAATRRRRADRCARRTCARRPTRPASSARSCASTRRPAHGAPGNPFAAATPTRGGSIAYGLRNPFRFAFRPGTNEIWLGDVGWGDWEEVDRVADATDAVAENFGWPCFEGDEPRFRWRRSRAAVPGAAGVRR